VGDCGLDLPDIRWVSVAASNTVVNVRVSLKGEEFL
jgi:hypothetical protein